ncbi:MAG: hypothetical protein K8T91_25630 [Planctomycetes bacterium]|nr:hypothetical protein [Planctomycetota bacterium]
MSVVHVSEVVSEVLARLPKAARLPAESLAATGEKMRIEQAIERFESLADLEPRPESWEAAMGALLAGAIDYDDIAPLLWKCCELADKAGGASPHNDCFVFSWDRIRDGLIQIAEACCDFAPLNTTVLAEPYLKVGRAADMALRMGATL